MRAGFWHEDSRGTGRDGRSRSYEALRQGHQLFLERTGSDSSSSIGASLKPRKPDGTHAGDESLCLDTICFFTGLNRAITVMPGVLPGRSSTFGEA